ncbi:TM2 domain-containing protein [Deinococcus sp. KNUC1210]|uniref:TM2 domain-containing protein n=1 Tax=Deinococcus sp. KNUC1210 TaxID=2917691 RepID=UPI001EF00796|nr:TM2 domain-containing protein [Deinococcus sp. KNUC1210]ULH16641.1 TM2 domain-containing protein [Deinococcus sp. KNUC1210]
MTNDPDRFGVQAPAGGTGSGRVSLDKTAPGTDPSVPYSGAPLPPSPVSQQGGPSPWPNSTTAGQSAPLPQSDLAQKKLIAGLLGIFLGSLGVHKFYLGINQPGIIMLGLTVGGWILFTLLAIILIGFVFLLLPAAVGLIGLIEGILYLTKTDADFEREYVVGKKPWF